MSIPSHHHSHIHGTAFQGPSNSIIASKLLDIQPQESISPVPVVRSLPGEIETAARRQFPIRSLSRFCRVICECREAIFTFCKPSYRYHRIETIASVGRKYPVHCGERCATVCSLRNLTDLAKRRHFPRLEDTFCGI
uniref:Uncharacterized protein n=1 Tax=Bionectria ochroleuca TaxID=29856 RepID=A0A8H7N4U3_BIOOC